MAGITAVVAYSSQRAVDKINYERSSAKIKNIETALNYFAGAADRYRVRQIRQLLKQMPIMVWSGGLCLGG